MPSLPSGTAIGLKIGPATAVGSATPANVIALPGTNQINLSWYCPSATATFNVKRSLTHGGSYTPIATNLTAMAFNDTNVSPGTLYFYVVTAVDAAGESVKSSEASASLSGAPSSNWLTEDVGAVGATGSFSLSGSVFTIQGSGADIWNSADEFRYVFQALTGDCSITARVLNMQNTTGWAKAGVMIRETLDASSQYVINFMSPANGTALQQRDRHRRLGFRRDQTAPAWLRRIGCGWCAAETRSPRLFHRMASTGRKPARRPWRMNANVYVGLAVCSHNDGTLCQAQFDNVTFSSSSAVISTPLPALIHRYSFNETSGTIAHDSVGGANGTLKGDATFDGSGHVVLDGTSGTYVSLPGNLLAGLSNVTIEAWVTNAVSPDNVALFSFDDGLQDGVGGGYLRDVLHDQSNGRNFLELASGSGSPFVSGYPGLGGQSVHVAYVYNPSTGVALIYTNGVLEVSQAVSTALTNVSANAAALGRSPWNGDPWLAGAIDEFRIYSGQLLTSDIAAAQVVGPDVLLTTNVSLGISQGSGNLTFRWPVAGSGFVLESSPVLGSDAVWTQVNITPAIVGVNNQVTVITTNATMFFRLRR